MSPAPASPRDWLIALLADPPDLSLLADPERWLAIKEHAAGSGVAEMVAYIARPHMAGEERVWCDQILAASWERHIRSIRALKEALAILDAAGIETLVLKGAILARRHYAPPFLRKPSLDIDLIVRDADLERACEALSRAGYRPDWPVPESRVRSHHVRMVQPSRQTIELHFRLSDVPYAVAVEEFFDRAVPYGVEEGFAVRVLGPADEIFHLVLHNAQHRFTSLFHFNELRRLWTTAASPVRSEAMARAAGHHFAGALALTEIAFRAAWREPFLTNEAALPKTWLHWRINERLYRACASLSDDYELPVAARRRWADFQLTDRPVDAARFAASLLQLGFYRLGRWVEGRKA